MMPERPLTLTAPEVRAVLAGRKTQHRVVLRPQPFDVDSRGRWYRGDRGTPAGWSLNGHPLPFAPGDRIWARYGATNRKSEAPVWILVEDVRVERLQDISEDDAQAEGADGLSRMYPSKTGGVAISGPCYVCGFKRDWGTTRHRKPGERMADNPWVAVLTWKREERGG